MDFFGDDYIQVERVWCGEETGTKLVVRHALCDIIAGRVIGFEAESRHRRELVADLSHRFSTQYPPGDFILDHIWCGPGEGAALRLQHTPSGLTVSRNVGYEPQARHRREMVVELFQKLRALNRPS